MNRKKSANLFNTVPVARVKKNMFDLSHEVKMSGKFGLLYPVLVMDTLPGDSIRDQMTCFMRFAPMLAPIMHLIDVSTHFFFVPNRLLCGQWEEFITGGDQGNLAPVLPFVTPDGIHDYSTPSDGHLMREGTLWDYLGLPVISGADPGAFGTEQISALPFRAYTKIFNDYYRDQNVPNTEVALTIDDMGDVSMLTVANLLEPTEPNGINEAGLYRRGWEKDYFTGALPWAQRGATVLMPLSQQVEQGFYDDGVPAEGGLGSNIQIDDTGGVMFPTRVTGVGLESGYLAGTEGSATINDFRRTLAIQKWLENNARGGGRYIEQMQSHFNQRVPDFRLQRAEYLGGGKQHVTISEVLQMSEGAAPVGDMAGHGISVGKTHRFSYRCQEHGWVIGILSVMPKTAYSQGIERMWSRIDKFDFAWPELAHLGEQEIKSKELFYSFASADEAANQVTFGYIPRYAEYKYRNDRLAGDFRTTLGFWHLSRNFVARPTLDHRFLTMFEDDPTMEETFRRIFAVQDGTDYLWMQLFHRLTSMRPLPYFGVPTL